MAKEKLDAETSAIFIAFLNRLLWRAFMPAGIATLVLQFATAALLSNTDSYPFWFAFAIVPGSFFAMQYGYLFYSNLTRLQLGSGRALYMSDRNGYRAKLKAHSANPLFKVTLTANIIALAVTALLFFGFYSSMN